MSYEEFKQEMARLNGLRFVPASLQTHWEALNEIPLRVLKAAIGHAQKTRTEFPTPYELRQDADAVAHTVQSSVPLENRERELSEPVEIAMPEGVPPLRITREWRPYCEVCNDLGMRTYWCGSDRRQSWLYLERCDRPQAHGSHEFVRQCECWHTNPALVRKRETQAKYAASGAQKKATA